MESSLDKANSISAAQQRQTMEAVKDLVTGTTNITGGSNEAPTGAGAQQPQQPQQGHQPQQAGASGGAQDDERKGAIIDKAVDILQTSVLGVQGSDQGSTGNDSSGSGVGAHEEPLKDEHVGDFIRSKHYSDGRGK